METLAAIVNVYYEHIYSDHKFKKWIEFINNDYKYNSHSTTNKQLA